MVGQQNGESYIRRNSCTVTSTLSRRVDSHTPSSKDTVTRWHEWRNPQGCVWQGKDSTSHEKHKHARIQSTRQLQTCVDSERPKSAQHKKRNTYVKAKDQKAAKKRDKDLSFHTLPYIKGAGIGGVITKSAFGKSGMYTLKCSIGPNLLGNEYKNKRKCIYEKNPWSEHSVLRQLDIVELGSKRQNPQSRGSSIESDSIMW
ncbi:hypothetical protein PR048_019536 [Dryococelus australis]|uniref:Uncharacterized protein n=1 Tax=Dryococelus australis TaxID=614101 RepID=A0ABQ9H434_9NEOP|nr:hypothetical protein PR048_019536 [Dryococelus australis]